MLVVAGRLVSYYSIKWMFSQIIRTFKEPLSEKQSVGGATICSFWLDFILISSCLTETRRHAQRLDGTPDHALSWYGILVEPGNKSNRNIQQIFLQRTFMLSDCVLCGKINFAQYLRLWFEKKIGWDKNATSSLIGGWRWGLDEFFKF